MYKIIGGDQKEYGPVTFEQLTQWIRDNRANAQTLVQKEGGPWLPLGSLPEFTSILSAQGQATGPGPGAPTPTPSLSSSPGPLPAYDAGAATYGTGNELIQQRAREMVQGPATGLMVTGVIGAILVVIGLVFALLGTSIQPPPADVPPELQQFLEMAQNPAFAIVDGVIKLAIAALTIFAAQKMRNFEGFGLVATAAILNAFPCTSPCCCIGLPVGIWVLVVLFKPEVKSAFR